MGNRRTRTARTVCLAFARGCPRSAIDLGHVNAYFLANGWRVKKRIEDANLVLVSTCGFNGYNETESVRLLSLADKRRGRDSTLIVTGCLAGIQPSLILNHTDAVVIPPKDLDRLDDIIHARIKLAEVPDLLYTEPVVHVGWSCFRTAERNRDVHPVLAKMKDLKPMVRSAARSFGLERQALSALYGLRRLSQANKTRVVEPSGNVCDLRAAFGCLGQCSYCAIRFACGPLRSKPLETLLAEFDQALARGFLHFRIIAGDLGPYGHDIGLNVHQLFEGLFQRRNDFRLTVRSINPKWFIRHADALTRLFALNGRKVNYLCVPMQSGSQRVLDLMRREHSVSEALHCLKVLRDKSPGIILDTQVLVGFPGETDGDFAQTEEFLRRVDFDRILVYAYSDRPNTAAARMNMKVPDGVIRDRIARLQRTFPLTATVAL